MAWFGPWDPKKFYEMMKRNPEIKRDEYEFVESHATLLKGVGMMVSRRARVAYKGDSMDDVDVEGVTDNIPAINNVQVAIGRGITPEEARRHAPVIFIGNDVRARFFESVDPIDKTIQVEGTPYQVVGVAKELGSVFGNSQDNFVMIPVESYFKTYGAHTGIRLVAKAIDQEHLAEAQDETRTLLRAYRHLRPGQDDNFSIFASEAFVSALGAAHIRDCRHGRGHCVGVHAGGRHRDHEHHAGGGDRAHPRDRHSQVAGGAAARYSEPVPGGVFGAWRRPAAWPAY